MSSRGLVARLPLTTVLADCGCQVSYRNAPPSKGDWLTCITHGAVRVKRRIKVDKRTRPV